MGIESFDLFDKGTEYVYGRYLLEETQRKLPGEISIPDDIPRLVEAVYDLATDPEAYTESGSKAEYLGKEKAKAERGS